jgi:matrix metalloproteinase-14 (membrane-inserted)
MGVITDLYTEFKKHDVTIEDILKVIKYLNRFGYLVKNEGFTVDDVISAVRLFQQFVDLKDDGSIEPKILHVINMPRCGCPDVMPLRTEEAKWRKNHLKYFISKKVDALTLDEMRQGMKLACQGWSNVTNITFEEVFTSQCDILVGAGSGRGSNFDGSGGTLAWAHLATGRDNQLQLMFDNDERWSMNLQSNGIYFVAVAMHELGHNLGLDHSRINTALMAPFYNKAVYVPKSPDDVERVQGMYGKPNVTPPTTPPTVPPTTPDKPTVGKLLITIDYAGSADFRIKAADIPGFQVRKE